MIRLTVTGALRNASSLPISGLVLESDEITVRGFPIRLGERVDLLPADALKEACDAACTCEWDGECAACVVWSTVRGAIVEGAR